GSEALELGTGQIAIQPAITCEHLLPFVRAYQCIDDGGQALAIRIGQPGRRDDRAPILELDIDALLAQSRRSEPWETLRARDREHAHGACFDLRSELGKTVDAYRHLAAEYGRHRCAATGERNIVHTPRCDTELCRDEARKNVIAPARGAAA